MAKRGRPRIHPEGMSPTEVKREWDKRMRNDNGLVPGEPKRKPCVIYLSDSAREVIRDERKAASEAGLAPVLTSKLIEDLLLYHAANPLREGRAGLSVTSLRDQIRVSEMRAKEAYIRTSKYLDQEKSFRPNVRTIRRLVQAEVQRPRPTLEDMGELFIRMTNHHKGDALERLMRTLRLLLAEPKSEKELFPRFRSMLNSYLLELLSENFEARAIQNM
jgi:hypothetical protein